MKPIFNISMADGWYGYIPPPEQHALGSYETWRGRTSPLATNAIPQIADAFLNLLEKTKWFLRHVSQSNQPTNHEIP